MASSSADAEGVGVHREGGGGRNIEEIF